MVSVSGGGGGGGKILVISSFLWSEADTLEGRNLLQKLNQYMLSNVIKEPTMITNTTRTLLDLVITSDRNKISNAGTHETGIADHRLVKSVQSALNDLKRLPERLLSQCNYCPFFT